jgi:uncharacterized protein YnzC (UPF0291/DUF896 family)
MKEDDIYIEPENVTPIHEINLVLTSIKVECEPRKIRAEWTPTMLDDLRYFEAIDPAGEVITSYKVKQRVRQQKRKERRAYIKEIEIWVGHKIRGK